MIASAAATYYCCALDAVAATFGSTFCLNFVFIPVSLSLLYYAVVAIVVSCLVTFSSSTFICKFGFILLFCSVGRVSYAPQNSYLLSLSLTRFSLSPATKVVLIKQILKKINNKKEEIKTNSKYCTCVQ